MDIHGAILTRHDNNTSHSKLQSNTKQREREREIIWHNCGDDDPWVLVATSGFDKVHTKPKHIHA